MTDFKDILKQFLKETNDLIDKTKLSKLTSDETNELCSIMQIAKNVEGLIKLMEKIEKNKK